MTATLSEARHAVEQELAGMARAPDRSRLARLGQSVGELSFGADALLVRMLERDADDALVNAAETLVDFFRDTDEQIAAQLDAGPG
ncbi:hypothetical protein [Rubellimicrobium mesophilum]|nr:hypothetical protein [Rubellimicrobium mesophilum]